MSWPIALLALLSLATASCGRSFIGLLAPRSVLIDETARTSGETCGSDSVHGANARLTEDERREIERALAGVVRDIPTVSIARVRLRISTAGYRPASAGRTIELPIAFVRALLGSEKEPLIRRWRLSFVIAHEVGHLVSPECIDACAGGVDCERQADQFAERLGSTSMPLLTMASDLSQLLSQLLAERPATPEAQEQLAWACLQLAAAHTRHAEWLVERSENQEEGDNLQEREGKRAERQVARNLAAGALKLLSKCQAEIMYLPESESRRCLEARHAAVDGTLSRLARVPIPEPNALELHSRLARFRDDAAVRMTVEGGLVMAKHEGIAASSGLLLSAEAAWERGTSRGTSAGVRATFMGFNAQEAGERPVLGGLQLVAAGEWARDRIELTTRVGVGAARRWGATLNYTTFLGSLDAALVVALTRRMHASLALGGAFTSSRDLFAFASLGLTIHLGRATSQLTVSH